MVWSVIVLITAPVVDSASSLVCGFAVMVGSVVVPLVRLDTADVPSVVIIQIAVGFLLKSVHPIIDPLVDVFIPNVIVVAKGI